MADVVKKVIPFLFDIFKNTSGEYELEIAQRRKLERDQSAFNRAISEEGALLKHRQSKLQTRTDELQSGQQKLQYELANTRAKVKKLENSTGEMRRLFHFVTMIFVFVIIFAYLLRA